MSKDWEEKLMSVWTDHYPHAGAPYDPNNPPPSGQLTAKPLPPVPVKTLRDEFAMAALTGMCASMTVDTVSNFAKGAYRLADAMMAERSKQRER